jgi:ankyrin repeat protein
MFSYHFPFLIASKQSGVKAVRCDVNVVLYSVLRDDHGFSPLHWACREGRSSVVDMLIMRGARINVMNRGDDTPLHLASSHGHRDIVGKVGLSGDTAQKLLKYIHTTLTTHTQTLDGNYIIGLIQLLFRLI